MTIKEKITKLNTGRVGSFGEYIFYRLCKDKKMKIVRYHKERTDFLLNEEEERIDVKTFRSKIYFEKSNITIYNGVRIKSIKYAVVDFFNRKAVITIEGKPIDGITIDELDYDSIELLYKEWNEYIKKYNPNSKEQKHNPLYEKKVNKIRHCTKLDRLIMRGNISNEITNCIAILLKSLLFRNYAVYRRTMPKIKNSIANFFKKEGFKTKIIHRTDQLGWGVQSAHNLLPQYKKKGTIYYRPEEQIRIYLDFITSDILELNLYQIIAYPEMRYKEFKLLEKPGLSGWDKVDLEFIPEKYIFMSIKDLMENYRIKFGI